MDQSSTPSGEKKPFRAWAIERRVYRIDILAMDAWEAKEYAADHREGWLEVDGAGESSVEEVRLHLGADFLAADGS